MSWLSDVISGGGEGLIKGIGEAAKDIRAAITGKSVIDPNKQAEIELKLQEMEQKGMEYAFLLQKAQTDINIEEAKNPNIFVSGWRPFCGWICGFALGWTFIGHPIFMWAVKLSGSTIAPPILDTNSLLTVLMAMLGIGAMRTVEKIKGSQSNH